MALIAQTWNSFKPTKSSVETKRAVQSVSANQSHFVEGICAILNSAVVDLYGNASEEKYQRIIELILERAESVIQDNLAKLTDTDIEELKQSIFDGLIFPETEDSQTVIDSLLQSINEKIKEEYVEYFDNARSEINAFLNEKIAEFQDKINSEYSKRTDILQQSESVEHVQEKTDEAPKDETEDKYTGNIETQPLNIDETSASFQTVLDRLQKCLSLVTSVVSSVSQLEEVYSNKLNELNSKLIKTIASGYQDIQQKSLQMINSDETLMFKKINQTLSNIIPDKKTKQREKEKNEALLQFEQLIDQLQNNVSAGLKMLFPSFFGLLFTKAFPMFSKFLAKVILLSSAFLLSLIGIVYLTLKPSIEKHLSPVFDEIKIEVQKLKDALAAVYYAIIQPFIDFVLNVIGPPLKKLVVNIANTVVYVVNEIKDDIVRLFDNLIALGQTVFNCILQFFEGFGSRAEEFFNILGKFLVVVGLAFANFINGFLTCKDQLQSTIQAIAESVMRIFDNFLIGFSKKLNSILSKLADFKIVFGNIIDNFLNGYNSYSSQRLEVNEEYIKQLESFKRCLNDINNNFKSVKREFQEISTKYAIGLDKTADALAKEQAKYVQTCYKIDQLWGNAVKDSGDSIGELQGKIIDGILKLLDLSGGNISSVVIHSKLTKIKDTLTFWKEEKHIPTPQDLINLLYESKGHVETVGDKLWWNNDWFWDKPHGHDGRNGNIHWWIDLMYRDFTWTLSDFTGVMMAKGLGIPNYVLNKYDDSANVADGVNYAKNLDILKNKLEKSFVTIDQLYSFVNISVHRDIAAQIKHNQEQIKGNETSPINKVKQQNKTTNEKIKEVTDKIKSEFKDMFDTAKNMYLYEVSNMDKIKTLIDQGHNNIKSSSIDFSGVGRTPENLASIETASMF